MSVTLDWFGTATFRLTIDGLVLWLDTYMDGDRPATAPPVGLEARDVRDGHFVLIGHSHFDHLGGADTIANGTGAVVIGSHESARVLLERGVPEKQLWRAQGGERYALDEGVSVRVYPSLHSHIWARAAPAGVVVTGDEDVPEQERIIRLDEMARGLPGGLLGPVPNVAASLSIGGKLDYLILTPHGSILFQDSMGYWGGIYASLRPDVALLAGAGRGNLDGEPFQGSMEQFISEECRSLRPRRVILHHHDNFMGIPSLAPLADMSPVHELLAREHPDCEVTAMSLGGSVALF